jgi:hypothetical protein
MRGRAATPAGGGGAGEPGNLAGLAGVPRGGAGAPEVPPEWAGARRSWGGHGGGHGAGPGIHTLRERSASHDYGDTQP